MRVSMGRSAEVAWVPDCSCARLASGTRSIAKIAAQRFERKTHIALLRNDNCVTRLQYGVLAGILSIDHFFVVKRVFHLLSVFHAQEIYIFCVGELRESARAGERLQQRHPWEQSVRPGACY